ncbi:hypothetical protein HDV06_005886 [Boothiomyces sp. JEL0866]|nr:hypothetical protein HDV06_005886 [Boothiomyces sp. JEL0866]
MNTSANADIPQIFQIGWLNNSYCSSAPNTMYSFSGITTTLFNQTSNEQYSLTSCGSNLFPMHGGCCYSNLDTNYLSGYASLVQRAAFDDRSNFPVSSIGAKYCHLKAQSNDSLYGYSDIWYKGDYTCVDSYYACGSTGSFITYTQMGCTGNSTSVQLNSTSSTVDLGLMGNVSAEFVTIGEGSESYTWIAYIPSAFLVYRYQAPMEILSLFCYLCAIGVSLGVFGYSFGKFIKTKSLYLTVVMISQLLWVLWTVMDFGYYNILFPSDASTQDYNEIDGCLFNLATLTTVFNTANFIIGFRNVTSLKIKVFLFSAIVLFHIIFAGGNYFNYMFLTYGSGTFWQKWLQLLPIWSLSMFIFNTVPAFLVAIPLVKSTDSLRGISTGNAIRKLFVIDTNFTLLFSLQILNTIAIVIFYSIQQYTQIPGSDRNFLSMSGIFALNYAIHAGINSLFMEHLRSILMSSVMFSSRSKDIQSYNSPSAITSPDSIDPESKLLNKL